MQLRCCMDRAQSVACRATDCSILTITTTYIYIRVVVLILQLSPDAGVLLLKQIFILTVSVLDVAIWVIRSFTRQMIFNKLIIIVTSTELRVTKRVDRKSFLTAPTSDSCFTYYIWNSFTGHVLQNRTKLSKQSSKVCWQATTVNGGGVQEFINSLSWKSLFSLCYHLTVLKYWHPC